MSYVMIANVVAPLRQSMLPLTIFVQNLLNVFLSHRAQKFIEQ